MIIASQLRSGMAIRYQGATYKVVSADYHGGQGKMGGVTHARLQNIDTGTFWEQRFRSDERLEETPLEKQAMEFLYADADDCHFMNAETFEQIAIPRATLATAEKFLQPEMRVPVEFFDGRPVSVLLPDVVEVRVAETAEPVHSQQDNTWKTAKLESGLEVMVPQFIRSGERIRVATETGKYVERAKAEKK
jgi:elongation factor P